MKPNNNSSTRIDEIANGIFRISTPVPPTAIPGGFTFNQYLVVDDTPLLYHTGTKNMFPAVRDAIASVIPVESLRYVGFSHYEADECGSLNHFLEAAPEAEPKGGRGLGLTRHRRVGPSRWCRDLRLAPRRGKETEGPRPASGRGPGAGVRRRPRHE